MLYESYGIPKLFPIYSVGYKVYYSSPMSKISFIILVTMLSANVNSYIENIIPRRKVFVESKKYFSLYVDKCLEQIMIKYIKYEKNMQSYIIDTNYFSDTFMRYSKNARASTPVKWSRKYQHFVIRPDAIANLIWTSGRILYTKDHEYMTPLVYRVKLNSHLSMNFSIQMLYFASSPKHCLNGYLLFLRPLSTSGDINKGIMKAFLRYCGYYSQTNIYPEFNIFFIEIIALDYIDVFIDVLVSVLDKHKSVTIPSGISSQLIISSLWIIKEKYIISYFIQMRKIYNIKIRRFHQIVLERLNIYDGPGFKSPVVDRINGFYICSTFQCVAKLLTRFKPGLVHMILHYNASLLIKHFSYSLHNLTDIDSFSTDMCIQMPCVIKITVPPHFQINATVINLVYEYNHFDISVCQFGGIAAYENVRSAFIERYVYCGNYNQTLNNSKSFYSNESTFIIIFYWYKGYSVIKVNLMMSLTVCKPINILHHTLGKLCDHFKQIEKCYSLLGQLTKSVPLSLERKIILAAYSSKPMYLLSFSKDSCVILQFYEYYVNETLMNSLNKWNRFLRAYLYPFSMVFVTVNQVEVLQIEIKGTLRYASRPEKSEYLDINDYHSYHDYKPPHRHKHKLNKRIFKGLRSIPFYLQPSKHNAILELMMDTNTRATFDSTSIIIDVQLFANSHSWVDLIFKRNNIQTAWKNKNQGNYRLEDEFVNKILSASKTLECHFKRQHDSSVLLLTVGENDESTEVNILRGSNLIRNAKHESQKHRIHHVVNTTLTHGTRRFFFLILVFILFKEFASLPHY